MGLILLSTYGHICKGVRRLISCFMTNMPARRNDQVVSTGRIRGHIHIHVHTGIHSSLRTASPAVKAKVAINGANEVQNLAVIE